MLRCDVVAGAGRALVLTIFCGGRPDKQQRKKAVAQEDKATSLPAPRIVDTSQRSLKSQLRIVKRLKEEDTGKGFAPAPRSKFRRKREPPSARGADTADKGKSEASQISELAQEEQQLSRGRGISSLYNTKKAMTNPPAVLVDGYNVLMFWLREAGEEARKARVFGDLEAGRLEILRDLSDYSGWRNVRMMVAFDAQGNPSSRNNVRDHVGGVETVFVGTGEADSFIISEAQQLRKSGCPYVLVATSDNDIRDTCWTNDIFPISSDQLLKEMRKARKEADAFYRRQKESSRTDRLGYSLMRTNPGLYAKLEKARIRSVRSS